MLIHRIEVLHGSHVACMVGTMKTFCIKNRLFFSPKEKEFIVPAMQHGCRAKPLYYYIHRPNKVLLRVQGFHLFNYLRARITTTVCHTVNHLKVSVLQPNLPCSSHLEKVQQFQSLKIICKQNSRSH